MGQVCLLPLCPSTLLPARDSLLLIQLCSLPQRSPSTAMGNDTNLLSSDRCWKQSYPLISSMFPLWFFQWNIILSLFDSFYPPKCESSFTNVELLYCIYFKALFVWVRSNMLYEKGHWSSWISGLQQDKSHTKLAPTEGKNDFLLDLFFF